MADADSGVVDPSYVLQAARSFLTVVQPSGADEQQGQETGAAAEKEAAVEGSSQEDGWEASGCLLWDVAAIPEQAALLTANNIQEILHTVIAASVAQEKWRALEIALGVLANLACHQEVREQLLGSEALAETVVGRALWVDDSPALAEGARLLSGLCLSTKGDDKWWELMTQPEGLGRIVWIIENTLSASLLEKALGLGCAMLQAARERLPALVSSLLELDILSITGGFLASYLQRLQVEQREFEGGSGGGEGGGKGEEGQLGDARQAEEGPVSPWESPSAAAGGGSDGGGGAAARADAPSAGAAAGPAGAGEPAAATAAAKGPEVSEAIVVEALALVDGLTATPAGSAAVARDARLVGAAVQLLALCESTPVRIVCASLLAPLEGAGRAVAARPEALQGALGLLAAAQQGVAVVSTADVAASWALCSAVLHAAVRGGQPGEGAGSGGGGAAPAAEGPGVPPPTNAAAEVEEVVHGEPALQMTPVADLGRLTALLSAAMDYGGVLLADWRGGACGSEEAAAQQRYCLRQVQALLDRLAAHGAWFEGVAVFSQDLEAALKAGPGGCGAGP